MLVSILIGLFEGEGSKRVYRQYYLDTILMSALGNYTWYGEDFYCLKLRPHAPGIEADFYARQYPKFPGRISPTQVFIATPESDGVGNAV